MKNPFYKGKVEKITLVAGHSIIMSHLPEKLNLENVSNKLFTNPCQQVASFGLFDTAAPNYSTYYPEVTVDDLNPKDSDFVEPVYRLLSNTVVQHRYNPIEFPSIILKASMPKLVGQTINIDHETALGNAIGTIKAVEWQESYKVGDFEIPAGINGVFKIDGKSNPRIARGIMMNPPSIHSNSVTVAFTWKPSHENLTASEFYDRLGTFDDKGKLIRKVATEIKFYMETSLVGMGADPFAQKLVDGKIINPGMAKDRNPVTKQQLSADIEANGSFVAMDWKDGNILEVSTNFLDSEDLNNNNLNNNNMDILRFLEKTFGLVENSLTEENYQAELAKVNDTIVSLNTQISDLSDPTVEGIVGLEAITLVVKEHNTLKATLPEGMGIDSVVKLATFGDETLSNLKVDTLRLYDLSLNGKERDENITELIEKADQKGLVALHKQYDSFTESHFELTCQDCGSTSVTRAKAKVEDEPNEGPKVIKSNADVINNITSKSHGSFLYAKKNN
jgi:hypothetical protein